MKVCGIAAREGGRGPRTRSNHGTNQEKFVRHHCEGECGQSPATSPAGRTWGQGSLPASRLGCEGGGEETCGQNVSLDSESARTCNCQERTVFRVTLTLKC